MNNRNPVHSLTMASSDTDEVPTVFNEWEPDLLDEENSLLYRHGDESNKDKKRLNVLLMQCLDLPWVKQLCINLT